MSSIKIQEARILIPDHFTICISVQESYSGKLPASGQSSQGLPEGFWDISTEDWNRESEEAEKKLRGVDKLGTRLVYTYKYT